MPRVKNCFCIFPIRRMSLIIGAISLVASVLGTLAVVGALSMWSTIAKSIREAASHWDYDSIISTESYIIETRTHCVFSLGLFLGGIIVSWMLLRGINQKRPGLMLPYVTTATIGVILGIVVDVLYIMDGAHLISPAVHLTLGTGLETHFIVVIYSHYQEICSSNKKRISLPLENLDTVIS